MYWCRGPYTNHKVSATPTEWWGRVIYFYNFDTKLTFKIIVRHQSQSIPILSMGVGKVTNEPQSTHSPSKK